MAKVEVKVEKKKTLPKYIYLRGDGQYQIKIRKKGFLPASATCPTLPAAEAWLTTTMAAMYAGVYLKVKPVDVVTLEKALTEYAEKISSGKKGETQELVRINFLKTNKLAKKSVPAIEQKDIENYIKERRLTKSQRDSTKFIADATIRKEVMLLSGVFSFCLDENYLRGINPCARVCRKLKVKESTCRTRRFVGDEESRLLTAIDKWCRTAELNKRFKNKDIPLVVRFAVATAARQSEIIGKNKTKSFPATPGITWEKVDLKMRSVTFTDTKNGFDRVVPLGSAALALLSALPRPINGGKVFNVKQDCLIRAMAAACEDAGIEDFVFHDLRHEATSRMIEDGHPTAVVQKITGHSSAEMTERYTHLDVLKTAMRLR